MPGPTSFPWDDDWKDQFYQPKQPYMPKRTPEEELRIQKRKEAGELWEDPHEGLTLNDKRRALVDERLEKEESVGVKRGGEPGQPGGRPVTEGDPFQAELLSREGQIRTDKAKKPHLLSALKRLSKMTPKEFRELDGNWTTMTEKLAWTTLNKAIKEKGWQAASEVWQRIEGKVTDKVDHTMDLGKVITIHRGSPNRQLPGHEDN